MLKPCFVSAIAILSLTLAMNTSIAYAEGPTAVIYPSEGTVETNIFLQVSGFGIGEQWDIHYYLFVFWDSKPILTGIDDNGNHFYDIYFMPPNEHPYSNLGNHTIYIELWKRHYGNEFIANFTLEFEIVEWTPCPAYINLNTTYHDLLTNYNDLLGNFTALQTNYNALVSDYNEKLDAYNSLLVEYDELSYSYSNLTRNVDSLNFSYCELKNSYEDLDSSYSQLSNTHSQLQGIYDDLEENYGTLSTNYDSLGTDYHDLQGNYDMLLDDLFITRNLSYLFIATTLILLATTIYFAVRKPSPEK